MNGARENVNTVVTKITSPNQMARKMPVEAALLSIFGIGDWRSNMGVGLAAVGWAGVALTARSLAQNLADNAT